MAVAAATAPAAAVPLSQKTHDSVGAADLEKVTDYAPEKEISGDIGKVNISILYIIPIIFMLCVGSVTHRRTRIKRKSEKS